MTYTQGPWKIQQTRIDDIAFVSDIHAPHQDNPSENGTDPTIATTWHRPCEGQAEANARLIAASPEMLESLIHLIELFENGSDGWSARDYRQHEENVLTEARNLIAKATGAEVEA